MRIAQEITTQLHDEGNNETEPTSEILISGKATGKTVHGPILEVAVSCNDCYLLFMTDDVPNEES
jgi:hypothetical protein